MGTSWHTVTFSVGMQCANPAALSLLKYVEFQQVPLQTYGSKCLLSRTNQARLQSHVTLPACQQFGNNTSQEITLLNGLLYSKSS